MLANSPALPSGNSPFCVAASINDVGEQPDRIGVGLRRLFGKPSHSPSFARRPASALAYFKFRFLRLSPIGRFVGPKGRFAALPYVLGSSVAPPMVAEFHQVSDSLLSSLL